jgi:hypothetical protein
MWIVFIVGSRRELRNYRVTGEPPAEYHKGSSSSKYQVDEANIREVLRQVGAERGSCPPWVAAAVDDWLMSADGPEKDQKRQALMTRMYWYSAFSADSFKRRKVVNQIRSAINPWVDEAASSNGL